MAQAGCTSGDSDTLHNEQSSTNRTRPVFNVVPCVISLCSNQCPLTEMTTSGSALEELVTHFCTVEYAVEEDVPFTAEFLVNDNDTVLQVLDCLQEVI